MHDYRGFGWTPPQFAHLPLLLNSDGTKLSKRQGDVTVAYYRSSHILPRALVNFVTFSGGGFHRSDSDTVRNLDMEQLASQVCNVECSILVKKINLIERLFLSKVGHPRYCRSFDRTASLPLNISQLEAQDIIQFTHGGHCCIKYLVAVQKSTRAPRS